MLGAEPTYTVLRFWRQNELKVVKLDRIMEMGRLRHNLKITPIKGSAR